MQNQDRNRPGEPLREPVEFGSYSSPPCFMHELDPGYFGLSAAAAGSPDGLPLPMADEGWPAIRRWRREVRARLIERRLAISGQDRAALSRRISLRLEGALASMGGKLVGFYWPFRGEYDARRLLMRLGEQGIGLALPVVLRKDQPLEFRAWWPGAAMTRGVWGIPIPANGAPVSPDILIAPLVGFDAAGYRLGYGGGFYDRTLATMPAKPRVIGVGFERARLQTIFPQPHDIAMDAIITETS